MNWNRLLSHLARIVLSAVALAVVAGTGHADGGGCSSGGRAWSRDAGRAYHGRGYAAPYSRGRAYHSRAYLPRYCDAYTYRRPVRAYHRFHDHRPRSYVWFGIGVGARSYGLSTSYRHVAPPARVYEDRTYAEPEPESVRPDPAPRYDDRDDARYDDDRDDARYDDRTSQRNDGDDGDQVDVDNEPPAGTYYHDASCHRRFGNLDDYTEHLQSFKHTQTIDIVSTSSNQTIRTLEFVDGYWQVRQ